MEGSSLVKDFRKVISLVDMLRDIGLGSQLELPKVVVLGTQSSGKSSLLEQIVGLDFLPRGAGIVTRRPLELRMTSSPTVPKAYAEFDEVLDSAGKKKRFTDFNEVRKIIDEVTAKVCKKVAEIIDKPIVLNVFSQTCPNLTIVDLPGITAVPVGDQPSNIYEITRNMALRYIKEQRSIILCVIPANQDLTTSEALKIMREIDPHGERSLGCLTKIDIMDRGSDARNILMNKEVTLRYGYVGIRNRCQEDVNNNVPVAESLRAEKEFFTKSPVYSLLPADTFGTEALTKKLTTILYQQIKGAMPAIYAEIKEKRKEREEELEKLGPGFADSDAELIAFSRKMVSSFLRAYRNSINGIKSEKAAQSVSSLMRELLGQLYKPEYDGRATEFITDEDIETAMKNYPGDSTIPGFPSIDAFLALLNPLLEKLQNPAYELNSSLHGIMETEAMNIAEDTVSIKFPEFKSRFCDLVRDILDKHRKMFEGFLNLMMDWEINYLYTNDPYYLSGNLRPDPKNKTQSKPQIVELRIRIDAYYRLVVRNLRDLVPKQAFNFLVVKCLKELEYEAFRFVSDPTTLKTLLVEPADIRERRQECLKAIKIFKESEQRLRVDPELSKLLGLNFSKYVLVSKQYEKANIKSPDQRERENEEKLRKELHESRLRESIREQKSTIPEVQRAEPKPDRNKQPSQNSNSSQPSNPSAVAASNSSAQGPQRNVPQKITQPIKQVDPGLSMVQIPTDINMRLTGDTSNQQINNDPMRRQGQGQTTNQFNDLFFAEVSKKDQTPTSRGAGGILPINPTAVTTAGNAARVVTGGVPGGVLGGVPGVRNPLPPQAPQPSQARIVTSGNDPRMPGAETGQRQEPEKKKALLNNLFGVGSTPK